MDKSNLRCIPQYCTALTLSSDSNTARARSKCRESHLSPKGCSHVTTPKFGPKFGPLQFNIVLMVTGTGDGNGSGTHSARIQSDLTNCH